MQKLRDDIISVAAIKYIILSMRPKQWTKNLVVFAALLFSLNLFSFRAVVLSFIAFFIFTLLVSGVYLLNDLLDVEEDKRHPKKSKRPIAAGLVSPSTAKLAFIVLISVSLIASFIINVDFFIIILVYFLIQIGYSVYLKHVVIIDVFSIASGFFLRVISGAIIISVPISSWLLICTFFISLFLALCKRRHEIVLLETTAGNHRKVLNDYNTLLLDQMIGVVTSSTLIAYTLYVLSDATISKFNTTRLIYTIPFVLYGIYRYLFLVYHKDEGGRPEMILLTDRPMLLNIFLYGLTVIFILYL